MKLQLESDLKEIRWNVQSLTQSVRNIAIKARELDIYYSLAAKENDLRELREVYGVEFCQTKATNKCRKAKKTKEWKECQ